MLQQGFLLFTRQSRDCRFDFDKRAHGTEDAKVRRVRQRRIPRPGFINLSILPRLLPGCMMSDVVSILGSLDFVMGECDR